MIYKFEKLDVWKLAMEFNSLSYDVADILPENEKYSLSSQIRRASTSIVLNIVEGSTSQSDPEQQRFLSFAIRSHIEVIACFRLIEQRNYMNQKTELYSEFEALGRQLFAKLQAFKKALE